MKMPRITLQIPIFLILVVVAPTLNGFVVVSPFHVKKGGAKKSNMMLTPPLRLSQNDDINKDGLDTPVDNLVNEETKSINDLDVMNESTSQRNDSMKKTLKKIGDGWDLLFSFGIQSVGLYFSVGLLLNICGFGYQFDLQHGLQIDTLENMRNENQFKREMQRSARQTPQETSSITSSTCTKLGNSFFVAAAAEDNPEAKMLETHWDE
eukprot:CAMPEP_0178946190 /NCGR_PEP_ID=MMETSP0789-20121207/4149_1 /TAXON_ID=3005 /ORGANISM="Rhizosolenia setigera, Strain CCMP 1694" /LENGTH=207 /DNA_ID=CAMNT_0020626157 /DNA_START=46 /DNA_END=669 /DNA_ORIENTATION=-